MDSIKDASAQHECSLLCKLDWGFSTFIQATIKALIYSGLCLIGLVIFIFSFVMMFEYEEGIADLSKFEILYSAIVISLLFRMRLIIKKSTVPWWKAAFSPVVLIGKFAVIELLIIGIFAILDLARETDFVMTYLLYSTTINELITFSTIITGLYCGVPAYKTKFASDLVPITAEKQQDTSMSESSTVPADSEAGTEQSPA